MRLQYEVESNLQTQTFEAFARRREGDEVVEYWMMGQVRTGTGEPGLSPFISEERSALPHL